MNLPTLKSQDLKNKKVLLRVDINSPIIKGNVIDNPRFKASAETISYLLKQNASVAVIAHQGRREYPDFLPLEQHSKILSKHTKRKIRYIPNLFGQKAKKEIENLNPGEAVLLENVRFFKDEKDMKKNRYKSLSKLFDLYINDAFSVSHREQGSIILPPKYIKSAVGLQFEKEIDAVEKFKIKGNVAFLLGGAKVEDYFPIFNLLKNKKAKIFASGVMANLFFQIKGQDLGYEFEWLRNNGYEKLIPNIKKLYKKYSKQIILPVDFGIAVKEKRKNVSLKDAPFEHKILDVGPKTVKLFKKKMKSSDSAFVKGPLGYSEIPQFSQGTVKILKFISSRTKSKKLFSLIGGGHSTTTIERYKIPNHFSYISLSGGALIQYISGKKLPGIEVLRK